MRRGPPFLLHVDVMNPPAAPQMSGNTAQTLQVALDRHRAGDPLGAAAIYNQVLVVDPQNPAAIHFLGVMACDAGRYDIGIPKIRRSLTLAPRNSSFNVNLGVILTRLGKLQEAKIAFEEALKIKPEFLDALLNL